MSNGIAWERHRAGPNVTWMKEDLTGGRWLGVGKVGRKWQWHLRGPKLSWEHGTGEAWTARGARRAADRFASHHVLAHVFDEVLSAEERELAAACERDRLYRISLHGS